MGQTSDSERKGGAGKEGGANQPEGELSSYFKYAYLAGKAYAGELYRHRRDPELGAEVLEHPGSGIRTWAQACDLRSGTEAGGSAEDEGVASVLFHYTDRKGFVGVVKSRCLESRVGESSPFGEGLYLCLQEPAGFGSKAAVVINNHWPCEAGGSSGSRAAGLPPRGASAWGPGDPRNEAVREAVLRDEACRGKADFCVPCLVSEDLAFSIWEKGAPELRGLPRGCNRWGEQQWEGRDIWVVQCPDSVSEGLDIEPWPSPSTTAGSILDVLAMGRFSQDERSEMLLRTTWLANKQKLGPTHPETLASLVSLAEALRLRGRGHEAEVLHRLALAGREERLGPAHPETLASADGLALALAQAGRWDEAEALHRRALEGSEAASGPQHPDSLAYAENLAAALAARAQGRGPAGAEAEALQRRAWEGRARVFGPHHPDSQASLQNLVDMMVASGKQLEAAELLAGRGAGPEPPDGGPGRGRGAAVLELIDALRPARVSSGGLPPLIAAR